MKIQRQQARGQRRPRKRPPHPGEAERVAERRLRAYELRKRGTSYRAIARQLGVDVHTAHSDVTTELAALRQQTAEAAEDVRRLELERCDAATSGLWSAVEKGDPKAVTASIRVAERRSRLLGLDAPAASKVEVTDKTATPSDWPIAELNDIHDAKAITLRSVCIVASVPVFRRVSALRFLTAGIPQ